MPWKLQSGDFIFPVAYLSTANIHYINILGMIQSRYSMKTNYVQIKRLEAEREFSLYCG